jgi:hypothetical protein
MKTIGILALIITIMFGVLIFWEWHKERCKNKTANSYLSGDFSALPDSLTHLYLNGVSSNITGSIDSLPNLKFIIHKEVTFERGAYVLTLSCAGTELVYANEDHIALIDSIPSKINELIELIKIQSKEQSEQRAKMEIINRNIQMIKAELNKNL